MIFFYLFVFQKRRTFLVLDLFDDDGLSAHAGGLEVSLNLASPFVGVAVLLPVTSEVSFKTLVEEGVHIPTRASTVLGPFMRPEFEVVVAGARARQPVFFHGGDEVFNSGFTEAGATAVGGVRVFRVLGPETVHGVRSRGVALLESKDVVVEERRSIILISKTDIHKLHKYVGQSD